MVKPVSYKGSLAGKKKAEVQEIASSLGLPADDHTTKAALEDSIRSKLESSTSLQADERFSGLFKSMQGRNSSPPTSKASKSIDKALGQASDAADQALAVIDRGTSSSSLRALRRRSSQVYSESRKVLREGQKSFTETTAVAQHRLSNAWVVVGLTLFAEIAFVLFNGATFVRHHQVGPFKWATLNREFLWRISLPNILALRRITFIQPFSLWILSSVILPLAAAYLIVFGGQTNIRRRGGPKIEDPSPVTFSIVRLALVLYFSQVSPTPLVSFGIDIVSRFAQLQLITASSGLAFAAYELIAEK